jgi:hypothetical protein
VADRRRAGPLSLLPLLLCLATAAPAGAQIQLGPQLSVGSESDFGFGGRLVFPVNFLQSVGLHGVIDGSYFTGGGEGIDSWIDVNTNVRVPIPLSPSFELHVGGGINFSFISFETPGAPTSESDTGVGLNVLGGLDAPFSFVTPFLELRAAITGEEQVVLAAGVTFGSRD